MKPFPVWFKWTLASLLALSSAAAVASVPRALKAKSVRSDSALIQEVSEIRVSPRKELDFDQDIERLAQVEKRYKERLPILSRRAKLLSPMGRIQSTVYRPTVTN